jgi:oligosaccharide repeat unit polymerase
MLIFADDGRALKYSILFFSFIGLFVAIQRWIVLIHMFGSIPAVILNAGLVYRLNTDREIKDFIPILPNFVYVGVFLVGIYTAYKKRFSFLTFLPFIGIVIKELTYFGRGEILFSLIEFLSSFFLFRQLLKDDSIQKFRFSKKNAIVASSILIVFLVTSASLVRVSRGSFENYLGTSSGLRELKDNFIISPSVYLYLSSDVGVLSKYLELNNENTRFGQNTFLIFYDYLAQLEREARPQFFQKGYYIPMWTNTGTYIRELHEDFGTAGIFLVPYLLGLIITWLWFKFFDEKNLIVFAFLVYFYVIIGHSFLMMITRLSQWYLSLFLIVIYLPFLEKIALKGKILNSLKV